MIWKNYSNFIRSCDLHPHIPDLPRPTFIMIAISTSHKFKVVVRIGRNEYQLIMYHHQFQRHHGSSLSLTSTFLGGVFVAIPKHQKHTKLLVGCPLRSSSSKLKSSLSCKFEIAAREAKRSGSYVTMSSSCSSSRPKPVRFFPVPVDRSEHYDESRMRVDNTTHQSPLSLHFYGIREWCKSTLSRSFPWTS
jgi:hypothetical protein